MALTSDCDFYGAILDKGINTVVRHVMRQRPSLFNYGTSPVRADPSLLCKKIDAAPGVTELITVLPAIPLLPMGSIDLGDIGGTDVTLSGGNLVLDFAVQLTALELDFHPGNIITLPAELSPPLQPQHLAFRAEVCAGLSCIPREVLKKFPIPRGIAGRMTRSAALSYLRNPVNPAIATGSRQMAPAALTYTGMSASTASLGDIGSSRYQRVPPIIYLPPNRFDCFCLDLFATGHGSFDGPEGNQRLLLSLDGIELQDLCPEGLENGIECYMMTLINRVVLPPLSDAISEIAFQLQEIPPNDGSLGSVQIGASTAVPHNPAIEDDQLKLFLNLEELTLVIPPITIGTGGGGGTPPTRIVKSRIQTGPASITGAVSEGAFRRIFDVIRDTGHFEIILAPQTASLFGISGSVSAHIKFHLANGTVDFQPDGTIRISELDVKWDLLDVTLSFDIPKLCFQLCGPVPWPPWWDCVDLGCLFEANPDFSFTISLPTGFTSEISLNAGISTYYGLGTPNQWLAYITPSRVDLDIIDIADTVGDILDAALDAAISALGLPSWVSDITSSIVDLVRGLLDIPDDLGEWLQNLIFDTLGVEVTIETYISQWLADSMPILALDDPLTALPADGALIPVRIPIEYLGASVDDDEITFIADVGG